MSRGCGMLFAGFLFGVMCLIGFSQWALATQTSTTIPCSLSGHFPPSVRRWCSSIEHQAQAKALDARLIAAIMLNESAGNPEAVSLSGAVGLMQVMPRDGIAASFMCINGPCFANRPSASQLFDPEFNLDYATTLLAGLIKKHGSIREALRAYGPMDVGYAYADLVMRTAQEKH